MKVKCPADSPKKCYSGVCYGKYEFCSNSSKTAEPCISEDFLNNIKSRETVCQAIAQGKSVTAKDPTCDMQTDCFTEFKEIFYMLKQGEDNSHSWKWILPSIIAFLFAAMLVALAILYFRKKAKRRQQVKEQQVAFNNDGPAVDVLANNRMNESRLENVANQRQQSTDPDPDGTDNNTEGIPLLRRETTDAGNAANSPDSGIAPASREISIHMASPPGSVSNTNSNRSSGSASVVIDMESQEANRPSTPANGPHPAEIESSVQRAMHMPTSIPNDSAELVTNQTTYNHNNNGFLE
ncbi:hypothetical protein BsWGS_05950 [Bradybaena similaris]